MASKRLALTTAVGLMLMVAGTAAAQTVGQTSPTDQTGQMNNAPAGYPPAEASSGPQTAPNGVPQGANYGAPTGVPPGVPGTPNTGAGGETGVNVLVLGIAAVIALLGAIYVTRRREKEI